MNSPLLSTLFQHTIIVPFIQHFKCCPSIPCGLPLNPITITSHHIILFTNWSSSRSNPPQHNARPANSHNTSSLHLIHVVHSHYSTHNPQPPFSIIRCNLFLCYFHTPHFRSMVQLSQLLLNAAFSLNTKIYNLCIPTISWYTLNNLTKINVPLFLQ